MNKLLRANFARVKRNKVFWGFVAFMAVFGAFLPIKQYMDSFSSQAETNTVSLNHVFFAYTLVIGVLCAVFCSLFLGTEYSDGTVRNKLMIGHRRSAIYLSNLITT